MYFPAVYRLHWYSKEFLHKGASNKGEVEKTSYFQDNCVNISKTVRDTPIVTIND